MLFNSINYGIFLIVVFVLFWSLARWRAARMLLLLAASYYFYANWNPTFLLLIWFSSTLDFFVGGALAATRRAWARRLLLLASLTANLGILATFKYANFLTDAVAGVLAFFGVAARAPHLNLILPVGISFYTFQTMSYVIDVYRGKLAPTGRYHEYLLYVSFFPQLVAGPIVRATDLLPQFETRGALTDRDGAAALWLIMAGLLKKVVIADYLAVMLVDRVFSIPEMYTSLEALAAIYAYALQIYCDFSGYTDVAIGSALLLGFRLPINFDRPYAALNPRDFWRRWHISLSTWFRDYLYIPLGGSRRGAGRTYFNLWVTMLLCGLWHGAQWKFVFWGFLHGGAVTATRAWQRRTGRRAARTAWGRAVTIVITFHFVCFAWVFFRAADVTAGFDLLRVLTAGVGGAPNLAWPVVFLMAVGYGLHFVPARVATAVRERFAALPASVQGLVFFAVVLVLYSVASSDVRPYIYYQF